MLTDDQKTALRAELAEATERAELHNPSVKQARDLARLCNDFIAARDKALALPSGPRSSRTTAKMRDAHDAVRERVVTLAVEFVGAEHLADLICRALDGPASEPAEAQASLPLEAP